MLRVITGKYRGRKILTNRKMDARPTMAKVRGAIFNIITNTGSLANKTIIDIFAGSGSFTFEALSRGARHSFVIDSNPNHLQLIQNTAASFGAENNITLLCCRAENMPSSCASKCELAFIDPPYHSEIVEATLISLHVGGWLATNAQVILEIKHDEVFSLPERYVILDERRYGITKIIFLRYVDQK